MEQNDNAKDAKVSGDSDFGPVIYEISALDLIRDGYFKVVPHSITRRFGINVPIIVSPDVAAAIDYRKPLADSKVELLTRLVVAAVLDAVKKQVHVDTRLKVMIDGTEVIIVLQPLASTDQRPVLTCFTASED